jgi:cyclopropane-fatty-acyl-phospholipid synthase
MNHSHALARPIVCNEPSFFSRRLRARLRGLAHGSVTLVQSGATETFGEAIDGAPSAEVVVRHPRVFRRVALGGTLGAAESFIDGDWMTNDLTSLVRVLLRNADTMSGLEAGVARYGALAARCWAALRRNTRHGSRRNISAHYDLGNDFFERMLDPTLAYSSAVFPSPGATLEEASRHKLDLVCRKLALGPSDHLLEIGGGWGSLALHAAEQTGARVTTTTISREQYGTTAERIQRAGLADRITLLERDYRDLEGRFDKLASIEMIEAVGPEYYATYFRRAAELLAPRGRFLLQAITIADQNYERHRREVDFIKRHVFPGSSLPSVTALLDNATRASDLRLLDLEDYGPHYARTLAAWRKNLEPHASWVVARYGERFWRTWQFYLAYCEAGFAEGYISVVQMLFERPQWRQA